LSGLSQGLNSNGRQTSQELLVTSACGVVCSCCPTPSYAALCSNVDNIRPNLSCACLCCHRCCLVPLPFHPFLPAPCSKQQTETIVAARSTLLAELHRVAADWQRVLPTLALQLLQVPRAQWHTVAAVQAMVNNLAAEREAVVGFTHTLIDEVCVCVFGGEDEGWERV